MENNDLNKKEKKNRIIVLYDSMFGNTKKTANAILRGLEAGDNIVDSCSIYDCEIENLVSYDAIGIGGPTHNLGMSKAMKAFVKKLHNINLKGKKAFVFETKLNSSLAGSSGKKILKQLIKMKMKILHKIITGVVTGKKGPLKEDTVKRMEQIGLKLADILYSKNKQDEVAVYGKEVLH
ncbi:MAG: flavodoxin domain-containing protein [Promethearchaeota archaeon]|jgi:flavorubredoxin